MVNRSRTRSYVRLTVVAGIVVVLVVLWFAGLLATVRPFNAPGALKEAPGGGPSFDKATYVDEMWSSRVLPTVESQSVPIETLLPAIEQNRSEACKAYGNDVAGVWSFLVSFDGPVTNVDTSSAIGTLTVATTVGRSTVPVKVAIGPVILQTSLRDALKFISFGQFVNEIQYAGVAEELNTRVEKDVLSTLKLDSIIGKKLSVKGAFSLNESDPKNLVVTPVVVAVQ